MPEILRIKWSLDDDGGGIADVDYDYKSHIDSVRYVFDSLEQQDKIPSGIATVIRKDGRAKGVLPENG